MRAIKKVEVTPIDQNIGKIINSFNTTDDKTKNAPSINAVENYVDNVEQSIYTNVENDYLKKSNASSTYLTKSDASSTYLTQTNASSTYKIKGDFAVLTGSVSIPSRDFGNIQFNYPSGFTKDNCFVIGYKYNDAYDYSQTTYYVTNSILPDTFADLSTNPSIYLSNSKVSVNYTNNSASEHTFVIDLVLMKI